MNIRKIYHGSTQIIKRPIYGAGHRRNDYGPGFYCTVDVDLAKEWAAKTNVGGYVNSYNIDTGGLTVLDLTSSEYTILHWLTILLQNRTFELKSPLAARGRNYLYDNFRLDYAGYDVIYGCRADDSYFSFAMDFLSGVISFRQIANAMYFGNLGNQFVIKSREAFSMLRFTGFEQVDAGEWYPKSVARDSAARKEYLDVERYNIQDDDIFITDILRERMSEDDPRIQRPISDMRSRQSFEDVGFFDL